MSLKSLLRKNLDIEEKGTVHEEITPEIIADNLPSLRRVIAYWRVYPDKFVDYLCSLNPNNTFRFFYYQRVYLRAMLRYKHCYLVCPRGFSKSFLAVMALMIKCILYPGSNVFVVSGGKEQSAGILSSKLGEICKLIPAFEKEIVWDTRKSNTARTRDTRDSAVYTFRNGSSLENVAMTEKTRGRRFQSGLMEEAASLDQDILNEVILPTLVVQRTINGMADENEVSNQSQIFITSAGYKNTFAYEKLLQFLCESVVRPNESIVLGDTYRIPVVEKLQPKDFITQLKLDGTFNEASFEREFESKWSGSVEGAFFSVEKFDKYRTIEKPEYEPNGRNNERAYYVLGVDVGRLNCTTEVVVLKVTPAPTGVPFKQIVNLYSFDEEHFKAQAIKIKQLFKQYHCKIAMIDANGLGVGLVDELVMNHEDPETGETLFGLGVYNDDDGKYRKFETPDTIKNAMFLVKANIALNTELYAYTQAQMSSGKLRFLIDEDKAKVKLASYRKNEKMGPSARAEYLKPYVMTSILRDQMANLIQENEGTNIILKQSSKTIKKDKFSALIYGLYWSMMEEKNKKSKKIDVSRMMLFN